MSQYNTQSFMKALLELQISLTEKQVIQFLKYYELLIEWNSVMNLTAITNYEDVIQKHFIDSLALVKACDMSRPMTLLDVGTGAGFPGLPLKIAFPHIKVTLLDSLNKRIKFLTEVVETLELNEVETRHGRAEDFAKPGLLRESFDLCVSRAVANLATLSEYCIPYVKKNGYFIAYKSEKIVNEKESGKHAVELLGGIIEKQVDYFLPESDIYRNLIVIHKIKKTHGQYPRKAGLPAREPLI